MGGARRFVAYGLKFLAAGGSLVIATNLFPDRQQAVGIAILVAVLIDTVTSNHKRLIAEVEAGYAYRFLAQNIGYKHNRELQPLLQRVRTAPEGSQEKADAQRALEHLEVATQKALADGTAAVAQRLAASDVKALQAISLDNERAAAQAREA